MINLYKVNNKNISELKNELAEIQKPAGAANFIKYTGTTEDVPGSDIKRSIWFWHHKVGFYRSLVIGLIFISASLWGYSAWRWFDYLVFGIPLDSKLSKVVTVFPDYSVLAPRFSPQPLQILSAELLISSPGKVDAVAEVINPNSEFTVAFDYHFNINGQSSPKQQGFILPGDDKLLVDFGLDATVYSGSANLVLEHVRWDRISAHVVKDAIGWQANRLDFTVSDVKIIRPGGPLAASANVVQFKLTNNSAYSFSSPDFYVGLYQGQDLLGVLPLQLDGFRAGETRAIDLRSFATNLNATSIKVFPLIDVYDSAVYVSPPA
ncbi:MAG: hypothetical protein Q7S66_04245 [bacterium]|nr:hypothetical protein [bacterium]